MSGLEGVTNRLKQINPVGRAGDMWAGMDRRVRWGFMGLVLVFFYVLPTLKIPILNTPQSDFASVLFYPVGIYVLLALGLNVVVGLAGLLDLGYVAFFAIGGLCTGIVRPQGPLVFSGVLPRSNA